MDSGPSSLHGSSTFQRFSQHEKFCINPLTEAFFQHLHPLYFFRLKKTCMSEGVKILSRRLYELYREQKRRLLYSWCNSVYLLCTKSCFSKQKKKEKYNPTVSTVHNTHILLQNTNPSSAMVSQNKALCNNAGLHCSCSQAVNSVRELI